MKEQQHVLDQLVLVKPQVSLWSGRRELKPHQIGLKNNVKPDLISLGSIKVIDPKKLNPMEAVKRNMERRCLEKGTRFLGGYAVPVDKFDELSEELEELKTKGRAEADYLINNYDQLLDQWIQEHPDDEVELRKIALTRDEIRCKYEFEWVAIRVTPVGGKEAAKVAEKARGLGSQMIQEIAQQAGETLKKSFEGKSQATQKIVRPFVAIREKLSSLAFVDPIIAPIVDEIDRVMEELPKAGKFSGTPFHALRGLAELLADADRLRDYAQAMANADDESDEEEDIEEPADQVVSQPPTESETNSDADVDAPEEEVVEEVDDTPEPPPAPEKPRPSSWVF